MSLEDFLRRKHNLDLSEIALEYNTHRVSVLNPDLFHKDVQWIAQKAKDQQECRAMLQAQSQQRLDEVQKGLQDVSAIIVAQPNSLPSLRHDFYSKVLQVLYDRSLDSFIALLSSNLQNTQEQHHSLKQDEHITTRKRKKTSGQSSPKKRLKAAGPPRRSARLQLKTAKAKP